MPRKEKVTKVIDGDTFETDMRKHPVRLSNVDTPEKRQPGYAEAKNALIELIEGQEVTIETKARDKYNRAVANVKIGNKSVNKAMKEFEKYNDFPKTLEEEVVQNSVPLVKPALNPLAMLKPDSFKPIMSKTDQEVTTL